MKKILLSAVALMSLTAATSQVYTANDSVAFASWTSVDIDGDGSEWRAGDLTGSGLTLETQGGCALSNSWISTGALTPDNIFISPVIDMSSFSAGNLSWAAGSVEATADGWHEEHYAVYLITNSTDLAGLSLGNFPAPIFEGTLTAGSVMEAQSFGVDAAISGQSSVNIVVRHFDCTDENFIVFDDVELTGSTGGGSNGVNESSLEVLNSYPNPATDVLNITLNEVVSTVSILSLDGKVISTENVNANTTTLNVANLSTGIYFYEVVTTGGDKLIKKFVKK